MFDIPLVSVTITLLFISTSRYKYEGKYAIFLESLSAVLVFLSGPAYTYEYGTHRYWDYGNGVRVTICNDRATTSSSFNIIHNNVRYPIANILRSWRDFRFISYMISNVMIYTSNLVLWYISGRNWLVSLIPMRIRKNRVVSSLRYCIKWRQWMFT